MNDGGRNRSNVNIRGNGSSRIRYTHAILDTASASFRLRSAFSLSANVRVVDPYLASFSSKICRLRGLTLAYALARI